MLYEKFRGIYFNIEANDRLKEKYVIFKNIVLIEAPLRWLINSA